jgi:hypothetical protein
MAATSAEVVLPWGDGEQKFALKGKQIEHIEKVCGAGFQAISNRLMNGGAFYADVREVIRGGLEGGGMPLVDVTESMRRWFDGTPLADPKDRSSPLATAQAVVMAAWFGVGDLEPGEARRGKAPRATRKKDSTGRAGGRGS